MPGFLSRLRSTLSRNRAGERPPRPPSPSWTERSRLADHDTGLCPRSGMFAVVWLNGVQVLIVFLKKFPYNTRWPGSHRQHDGNQPPRPRNLYELVRPMPQDNPFDMKAGRKFTLFLGQAHFLVELVEILSGTENPPQPLPQQYRHDDMDEMQSEMILQNDSGSLRMPPLARMPPPNSRQTRNSPADPEPGHGQEDTPSTIQTSDHRRRRCKRDYDKELPNPPQPLPGGMPSGNLESTLFGKQYSYSPTRQEEPVVNSSLALAKGSSRKSRGRRQKGKQAERYRDVPRSESRFFPDEGPSNGWAYKCDQCQRPSNPTSSRGASRHSNDTITRC